MARADSRPLRALKRIRQGVERLQPEDLDAIIDVGASLEEAMELVPEGRVDLVEALRQALQALQAVYQGQAPAPRAAVQAVGGLVGAAERCLGGGAAGGAPDGGAELEAARLRLAEALAPLSEQALPRAGAPASEAVAIPGLELTLDDVSALVVQAVPGDAAQAREARQALGALLERASLSPGARARLDEAARLLEALAEGRATEPAETLALVGQLLEAAGGALEDDEPAPSPAAPAGTLPPDVDAELVAEFVVESLDYIEQAEAALLALETRPDAMEAVDTVFRAFHTIKGTSAFLGLRQLSELAHGAESLLSRVRDREIRFADGYADLALRSVDMLKGLLQAVQDAVGGQAMATPAGYDQLLRFLANPEDADIGDGATQGHSPPRLGDLLVAEGKASREDVELAAVDQGEEAIGVALVRSGGASLTDVARALRTQQRLASAEPAAETWVRVRTDRLDGLIDMVGELVIAQSMVTQDATVNDGAHHELARKVSHAGKIVRELQDLSMLLRMVPLKATFQKMARVVRDVARKSGKQVELVLEGEDTEIDRHMVDVIADPLVHMVRNGVDHGIEPPDVRRRRGKPAAGTLRLAAYHAGGNIVIEVQDDGKGLDREAIASKAVKKGLIESDKGLSDSEVFSLIFAPGFSTAQQVTDVSGRGVGMDVVKRNIETLRGHIDIASEPGRGCTFVVRLPLTLAITDGMLVRVGQERYIVPTTSIALSFQPDAEALFTVAERGEMVLWRGEALPLFRLHRLFDVQGAVEDPTRGLVIILGDGEGRCALLVDELLGQQQAVAKSLGEGLGKIRGIAGGAILGDGRVGLILDTNELVALARRGGDGGGGSAEARRSVA